MTITVGTGTRGSTLLSLLLLLFLIFVHVPLNSRPISHPSSTKQYRNILTRSRYIYAAISDAPDNTLFGDHGCPFNFKAKSEHYGTYTRHNTKLSLHLRPNKHYIRLFRYTYINALYPLCRAIETFKYETSAGMWVVLEILNTNNVIYSVSNKSVTYSLINQHKQNTLVGFNYRLYPKRITILFMNNWE